MNPEKTDLFGNPIAPTVEQVSLFAKGVGTAQQRDELAQLARKDQPITAAEMSERRDALGAPQSEPDRQRWQPYQLGFDVSEYGANAGKWIIVTEDGEREPLIDSIYELESTAQRICDAHNCRLEG